MQGSLGQRRMQSWVASPQRHQTAFATLREGAPHGAPSTGMQTACFAKLRNRISLIVESCSLLPSCVRKWSIDMSNRGSVHFCAHMTSLESRSWGSKGSTAIANLLVFISCLHRPRFRIFEFFPNSRATGNKNKVSLSFADRGKRWDSALEWEGRKEAHFARLG